MLITNARPYINYARIIMAFVTRCDKCGVRYNVGDAHACSVKPARSAPVSDGGPKVDRDPPEKSPAEKTRTVYPTAQTDCGPLTPEEIARLRVLLERSLEPVDPKRKAGERQKRWREKNREAYNRYMREYRKRTK